MSRAPGSVGTMRAAAAGLLLLAGATAAMGAPPSAITNSLVADISATSRALALTDEIALQQSGSARVRAVAQRDRALQAATLDTLAAWADSLRRDEAAEAAAPTIDHLGPLLYRFNGAFRSDIPGAQPTARESEKLARLRALHGADLDAAYLSIRETALRHELDLVTDYIRNGDDQTLRAFSVRQRPKVQAALGRR